MHCVGWIGYKAKCYFAWYEKLVRSLAKTWCHAIIFFIIGKVPLFLERSNYG